MVSGRGVRRKKGGDAKATKFKNELKRAYTFVFLNSYYISVELDS